MARLPRLSDREVVKVFESLGWEKARQSSSHIILVRAGHPATLSVPDHKEVAKGTLRSPIRSADVTVEAFVDAALYRGSAGNSQVAARKLLIYRGMRDRVGCIV